MSSDAIAPFLAKFDEQDTKKKGVLELAAFKKLFPEVMGGEFNEETAEMYFRGIDIDNSKSVSRQEFSDFVKAALDKDATYTIKMAFRSFDKDRSKNLDAKEVKAIAGYVGRDMTDEEVAAAMEKLTGKSKGTLTYPQVVKMITGKDIDKDADPYDGKLKSSCCLLI
ncbi:EF hand family protein [Tritrichomonas foetus]|uniref:EF hand family protein n=1 Tax=Tritrichomonas foetus TaxID=1144522 RepID=A0A1J4J2G1_9EUKA|nr:EF hand family protein [Tritrichomonas foetus]|eukprot:OHS93640.1 EF hand family protein [Tritrichomonas foetus]